MSTRLLTWFTGLLLVVGTLGATGGAPAAAAVSVFPVPSSSAGLGRIVTAPNGDLWFVETKTNKVGKITPAGVITEYPLPQQTVSDSSVESLDVAPDGSIWVVYDSGWRAVQLTPNGTVASGPVSLGDYPYGEDVRVAADGTPWITMNYDEDGIARIVDGTMVWWQNAPECDGPMGRGADGAMWCQQFDKLVRVNADAAGGVSYPLPANATYPYSMAAGPVGSIWFARHDGGTMFTSRGDGNVGYLDQASGATQGWATGSRTAPSSLIAGPDGAMWFTSTGAAKGIGHVFPDGRGVISAVGSYAPTSLTFGTDGAVWFTDATNNSIVRVTVDQLDTPNVDVGRGSQLLPLAPVVPPPAPVQAGAVKASKKVVRVKGAKVPVTIACPATATGGCSGTLTLHKPRGKRLTKTVAYTLAPGKTGRLRPRLIKAGKRALKRSRIVKVQARLVRTGDTEASVAQKLRLRR